MLRWRWGRYHAEVVMDVMYMATLRLHLVPSAESGGDLFNLCLAGKLRSCSSMHSEDADVIGAGGIHCWASCWIHLAPF